MKTTTATTVPARPIRSRRRWLWLAGSCLIVPPLLLAIAAWSYFALPGEAAALRDTMMQSTAARWRTTVQADVGRVTLAAVRAVVGCVQAPGIEDARLALRGIRRASAGVYRRSGGADGVHGAALIGAADAAMRRRGWMRVIGVTERDRGDTVLIYAPQVEPGEETVEVCLAVLNSRELVVVTATIAPGALAELIARHLPADWRERPDAGLSQ